MEVLLLSSPPNMAIQRLIRSSSVGANKKATSGSGGTPLICASSFGHPDVAKILVEAGADKEAKSDDGGNPLPIASQDGELEIVKILIEAGADVETWATFGITPLHVASLRGHSEVVKILIEAGADQDATTGDGVTVLLLASKNGKAGVARLLARPGANQEATVNGATAMHVASEVGCSVVIKFSLGMGLTRKQQTVSWGSLRSSSPPEGTTSKLPRCSPKLMGLRRT
jgi:ankyrin repeat protein